MCVLYLLFRLVGLREAIFSHFPILGEAVMDTPLTQGGVSYISPSKYHAALTAQQKERYL